MHKSTNTCNAFEPATPLQPVRPPYLPFLLFPAVPLPLPLVLFEEDAAAALLVWIA